jgi:hypothetical protein
MWLQTLKSRDGKLVIHGTITWRNGDEFGFVPAGKGYSTAYWCKEDYWEIVEGFSLVGKITVT